MRVTLQSIFTNAMLLAVFSAIASQHTDTDTHHDHQELPVDSGLTLGAALDEALRLYPSTVELEARLEEATTWIQRSKSWLADSPSLSFRYQSDRFGDDNRLEEFETGIELPLWRRGERGATRMLGRSLLEESQAAGVFLRWRVAGLLRNALWDVSLASEQLELVEAAIKINQQLAHAIERRHELGDVPLTDVLLAQSTLLETQDAIIDARANLLDSERAYQSLTRLDRIPEFNTELKSTRESIVPSHPALLFVEAQLRRAEANYDVSRQSAKGSPTLLLGPRRERPAFGDEFDQSLGITLTVPLGGRVHTRAESAAAARDVAAAQAARSLQMRQLELRMHEAAHGLVVVTESLATANKRAKLAERHYAIGNIAYEKGEMSLLELLRLQSAAHSAKQYLAQLTNHRKRQLALYNQAVGELP